MRTLALSSLAVLVVVMTSCNSNDKVSTAQAASAAAPAPKPVFMPEQNDTAGFDQIPWGTSEEDKSFHFENGDCDSYKVDLARVVGPPVHWPSSSDLEFSDAVSRSGVGAAYVFYKPELPAGVSVSMKDEATCYGFYDSKLAFAFQYVGNDAFAATKGKYPLLASIPAESWGDRTLPSYLVRYTANEEGSLFRRGDTNTRIYLFGGSLMYIPNSYLLAIGERWKSEYDKAAAAAAEQQRQYEAQQKEAASKAVQ